MQEAALLYITAADREEAETIARALLEERLIACANIIPGMTSLYRWEGIIRQGSECVMIVKTMKNMVNDVTQKIVSLHSYDCPCVIEMPVDGGNKEFLRWIEQETTSPS